MKKASMKQQIEKKAENVDEDPIALAEILEKAAKISSPPASTKKENPKSEPGQDEGLFSKEAEALMDNALSNIQEVVKEANPKKLLWPAVATATLAGGTGGFFAGKKYEKNKDAKEDKVIARLFYALGRRHNSQQGGDYVNK